MTLLDLLLQNHFNSTASLELLFVVNEQKFDFHKLPNLLSDSSSAQAQAKKAGIAS